MRAHFPNHRSAVKGVDPLRWRRAAEQTDARSSWYRPPMMKTPLQISRSGGLTAKREPCKLRVDTETQSQ